MDNTEHLVASIVDSDDLDFIRVLKDKNGAYHVEAEGFRRHSPCSAEDVIRAMAHYCQNMKFELDRLRGYD